MLNQSLQSAFSLHPPRLIIFDFDGTLAETEIIIAEIFATRLAALGCNITPVEIAAALAGKSRSQERNLLEQLTSLSLAETFLEEIYDAWREAVRESVSPTPGTLETLQALTIPFCVASNSTRKDLIVRMRAARIFDLIGPRFFSAHDLGKPKPDPSVFLLAAEAMGVAPADCLVIEDSVTGIRAAQNAGMRCCAFIGAAHQSEPMHIALRDCGPDGFITKISDILSLVHLKSISELGSFT